MTIKAAVNTPNRHWAYLRNIEAAHAPEAMPSEPVSTYSLFQIRAAEILIRRKRGWGDMVGSRTLGSFQNPFVLFYTCPLRTYSELGFREREGIKGV